jgi:hypothetical protein
MIMEVKMTFLDQKRKIIPENVRETLYLNYLPKQSRKGVKILEYSYGGRAGIPGQPSEGGISMKRRTISYFLSAATVYVTISHLINAIIALFANIGLTVI